MAGLAKVLRWLGWRRCLRWLGWPRCSDDSAGSAGNCRLVCRIALTGFCGELLREWRRCVWVWCRGTQSVMRCVFAKGMTLIASRRVIVRYVAARLQIREILARRFPRADILANLKKLPALDPLAPALIGDRAGFGLGIG